MSKTAIITGTTSGIGEALAKKLALEKYDLVLVSRNENKLKEQAQQISEQYKVRVYSVPIDLLKEDAAKKIFAEVQKLELDIQLLINNAGFNEYGFFLDTDLQNEIDMITLHAVRTTELMKLFLPKMVKNKQGRILNIGSTGSHIACPSDAVYAATKAYVLSVSKAINSELKGSGVSVTTLCPGSTNTKFAYKAGMENTLLFRLFVMSSESVANIGYKAVMKRKKAVVAGLFNKLLVLSSKILPSSIINRCTKLMLKAKAS